MVNRPKLRSGERFLGWEMLGAHGQEALFKRSYRYYYGDYVRFAKSQGLRSNNIYAIQRNIDLSSIPSQNKKLLARLKA